MGPGWPIPSTVFHAGFKMHCLIFMHFSWLVVLYCVLGSISAQYTFSGRSRAGLDIFITRRGWDGGDCEIPGRVRGGGGAGFRISGTATWCSLPGPTSLIAIPTLCRGWIKSSNTRILRSQVVGTKGLRILCHSNLSSHDCVKRWSHKVLKPAKSLHLCRATKGQWLLAMHLSLYNLWYIGYYESDWRSIHKVWR